jgi:hypothetical protein
VSDAPIADHDAAVAARARRRIGPFAFFVALWAAAAVPYLASGWWLGGAEALTSAPPGPTNAALVRFNLVYVAVMAFIATSLRHEHAAIRRDFEALRAGVDASDAEWQRWRASLFAPGRARVAAWIVIGVAVGEVVNFLGGRLAGMRPGTWGGHYVWMGIFATVLFALIAVLAALSMRRARVFLAMGRRARVNLLDPGALAPFARVGLRAAAYWFLGTSIATLLMIDAGAWGLVAVINTGTLALGVVSLLLPSRGVNESLRKAKERELARVRGELERLHARLFDARTGADESARTAALIAWEARVAAAPVWPFDTPTLVRFALFLLVPLGSWLGGALVERAVEVFLR